MTEKLCLQWNDFKDNISSAFETLRKDSDFTDVTLACEDGQQLEVHKVILAASSPFYRNIFKRNKHAHPLIFMRNVKFVDLEAIIDFLYCGETNIFQENLDSFLALAEDLQLKGLMGGQANSQQQMKEMSSSPKDIKREQPLLQSTLFSTDVGRVHTQEENFIWKSQILTFKARRFVHTKRILKTFDAKNVINQKTSF